MDISDCKEIIFLFGAGASFGAGGILPGNPPLGFQLYDDLEHIYPGTWGALPPEFKKKFRSNFEIGMGAVYAKFGSAISKLMRDMAVYFAQFRPLPGKSHYCKLVDYLNHEKKLHKVLFSTLNYECVLEYSLLSQSFNIDYFGSTKNSIPVWKLHGSCNMFSENLHVGQGITYGTGIAFEGGIKAYLDTNKIIEENLAKSGLAPIMCLFMEGKPLQVSPSSIKQIQEAWTNQIANAKEIYCIGVNPLPADTHIWDCLAETNATINFIGDKQRFEEWCSNYRRDESRFISKYFHTGFKQLLTNLKYQ